MLLAVLLFAVTLCVTIPTNHASCSQKPHCTLFKGQCWCKTKENQAQREACGYEVGYDKQYHSIASTESPHSLILALKLTPDPIYCPDNTDCSDSCAVNYCLTGDGCVGSTLTCNTDKERWESLGEELIGIARCTNYETDVDAPTVPTKLLSPVLTPVNGNWGDFRAYSACSRSCGGGFKVRTRTCNNPAPSNGGAPCAGSNVERVPCNPAACPDNVIEVQFEHYIGACVNGSNMLPVYLDHTIEECKQRCKLNPACKAIEYYHNGAHKTYNKCVMQSSKDRSGCVGEDVDLYIKVRRCLTHSWCGTC